MRSGANYVDVVGVVGAGVAVAAGIAVIGGSTAFAGSYDFTLLADTSGIVLQFQSAAALSDNRGIACRVTLDDQEDGIVRVHEGTETLIASTAAFNSFLGDPDINDAGMIGFQAQVLIEETARPGVYVGDGETITVVGAPNSDPFGANFSFFEMDAASQVLMGELASNLVPVGLAVGDGGPVQHVYNGHDDFANNSAILMGDLADSGRVAAIAGPGAGLRWTIWQGDVNGSVPVCIAGLQEFNTGFEALAANNAGDIAFMATHFTDDYQTGVYLWTGGPAGCDSDDDESYVEIAHQAGAFSVFHAQSGPAINDARTVAFLATLDVGGQGIFTGSDPAADKVIASGDALDGSTVVLVEMNRFALNAAGEIAFYALLADGRTGIYLATPVAACPGDVDGNDDVGFGDILRILAAWGNAGGPEDVDGNGTVGFGDILAVLGAWGPCA